MKPSYLMGAALWLPSAVHAACPMATTLEILDGSLTEAVTAYKALDLDSFTLAMDSAALILPCLGEPLNPEVAAHYHRMKGLAAVIGRNNDDAALSFTAARAADPNYAWPEDLVPPGHIIRSTYGGADPSKTKFTVPAPPEAGALWFDGAPGDKRPTTRPTVFQWVDGEGKVQATALLAPTDELPAYPAKVVATPEPTDVATDSSPTESPVASTPVKPPRTGGSVALPAAATGGAVALGAGSAVLFFGPTKSAFSTYNTMWDSGDYAGADAHFDSKVVPPRTASQVLAGAAVATLGLSAYLWTQSVSMQPAGNGLALHGRF